MFVDKVHPRSTRLSDVAAFMKATSAVTDLLEAVQSAAAVLPVRSSRPPRRATRSDRGQKHRGLHRARELKHETD